MNSVRVRHYTDKIQISDFPQLIIFLFPNVKHDLKKVPKKKHSKEF